MLPLNSIPTEVIRKSLVPYQGFMMPFDIDLTPKDRGMLSSTREQISRFDTPKQAELRIDPTPIFKIFVDLFGYDLAALREGGGECGVPDHSWNTFGKPKGVPLVIRWQAFGGEALLCIGGIDSHQYYVVAVADKAITPHLLRVLKALESIPFTKPHVPTEESAAGKVALKTKVSLGSSPFDPKLLSATFSLRDDDLEAGGVDLMRQLDDLCFSASWQKRGRLSKSTALLQLTWNRRVNGHSGLPWTSEHMPDLMMDFHAGDIIPAGLIDHVRRASVDDAEAVMQLIVGHEFITREELTQCFLIEERLSVRQTILDPELAERQALLWSVQDWSFRQVSENIGRGAAGYIHPRAYFSQDFRQTIPSQLVDTAPAQVFMNGEVDSSTDVFLSVLRCAYQYTTYLVEAANYRERAMVKGEVVATTIADTRYGQGNRQRVRACELDLPYFAVYRGLPVRVCHTAIGWREGMTEALACDFHMDLHTPSILYAALRRVPIPKEWKEEAA